MIGHAYGKNCYIRIQADGWFNPEDDSLPSVALRAGQVWQTPLTVAKKICDATLGVVISYTEVLQNHKGAYTIWPPFANIAAA